MKSPLETYTNTRIPCVNVGTEVGLESCKEFVASDAFFNGPGRPFCSCLAWCDIMWYQPLMLDCLGNHGTKVLDVGSLIKQLYILWRFMGKWKATDSSFESSKSFNRICPNHRFMPCGLSTHLHRHWCSWRHAAGERRTSLLGQITHSNKTRASPFPTKYMAKTLFTKTKKRFLLPREIRTDKNHQKPCSSCCPTCIKFTYHNL